LAKETNLPCRWSTIYLSHSACSSSSQFTDRAVPVPVGCRINMKEGHFVNLIRKKRCAGYGVYRLVSGAMKPREFPSFLLRLIFLVFSCAKLCSHTWHISSVLPWMQCYPEYIPHPSFESGNRRNVFILVRVHRAHTNGGTGVWAWGFEWLWLHFRMWCVLWW
jgi:hypothetical protein